MKYYIVDSFAEEVFRGNPAGVCLPEKPLPEKLMQKIAAENNLSETAFVWKEGDVYRLRWFTPECEIDLCGHATLAAAYVLFRFVELQKFLLEFETQSGRLSVRREGERYAMDFPRRMPGQIPIDSRLERALGCKVLETHLHRDLVALVQDEDTVANLKPDFCLLSEISRHVAFAVVVTAKGKTCDFVSRFFAPNCGINEDPVTGSSHSVLIPFWSERLSRTSMTARQLSPRGGTLYCEDRGERVVIAGSARLYLSGKIIVED